MLCVILKISLVDEENFPDFPWFHDVNVGSSENKTMHDLKLTVISMRPHSSCAYMPTIPLRMYVPWD